MEVHWEQIEIHVKHVEKKFDYLAKLKANEYEPFPIEIAKMVPFENSKAVNKQASFKRQTIKVNAYVKQKPKRLDSINKENVILDDVGDIFSSEDAAPLKIKRDSIAPKYKTPTFQGKSILNLNRVSFSAATTNITMNTNK